MQSFKGERKVKANGGGYCPSFGALTVESPKGERKVKVVESSWPKLRLKHLVNAVI